MMNRLKVEEKAECEVAVRDPDIFYMQSDQNLFTGIVTGKSNDITLPD